LLSYSKPYRESARKNVLRGTLRSTDQSLGGFGRAHKQAKMGAVKLRGDWGGSNEKPLRRLDLKAGLKFTLWKVTLHFRYYRGAALLYRNHAEMTVPNTCR